MLVDESWKRGQAEIWAWLLHCLWHHGEGLFMSGMFLAEGKILMPVTVVQVFGGSGYCTPEAGHHRWS